MPAIRKDNGPVVISSGAAGVPVGIFFFVVGIFIQAAMVATLLSGGSVQVNNRPVTSSMPQAWFPILFPTIFWVAGIYMAIYSKNVRYEIDDAGLRQFDWRNRKLIDIAWKDVTSYSMNPGLPAKNYSIGGLKLGSYAPRPPLVLTANGAVCEIPTIRYGWPLIDGEITRHLPQFKSPAGRSAAETPRVRPEIPASGLVFRQWQLVAAALILMAFGSLFAAMPLIAASRGGQQSAEGAIPFVFIGGAILLGGLLAGLYLVNGKLVLTESDIARYGLMGQVKDRIYWSDVEAFEFETVVSGKGGSTTYYVLRTRDAYMRFNNRDSKWVIERDAIVGMLPAEARVDLG
jgi:hypothetical protein